MTDLFKYLNQPLPAAFLVILAIGIGSVKIKDLTRRVESIENRFNSQIKWCMKNFRVKNNPEGGEK